jgi:ABC-2 type transport system ATP-binding protein
MLLAEVRHLRKSYGNHLAVKDVSFSIQAGEVFGLLGPNGAGKSTSMLMLAGLLAPSGGEVLLNGQLLDGGNLEQRRLLGLVPQEFAIYPELSGVDNLKFFGSLYGLGGKLLKSRCDEILDQIGLTENAHRPVGTYSGGMKRRLNFGVALVHRPALLILDEPTVGIDPQSRSHLMDCIRQQSAEGIGVVYASHYMEEVQSICHRVAIMDHGEILANDSISNLLTGLAADLFLYVENTEEIGGALDGIARIGISSDGEPTVIVSGDGHATNKPANPSSTRSSDETNGVNHSILASDLGVRLQLTLSQLEKLGIAVLRIETQQSNLERLFLQMTGKRLRD